MTFIVECNECNFEDETESYQRAKELVDQHHIPTGHHPHIKEE